MIKAMERKGSEGARPGADAVILRSPAVALVAALALLVAACGPGVQAPGVDDSDYVFPEIRRGDASPGEETMLRRAWNDVLAGRVDKAEQALNKLLAARPGLRPAQIVLGFAGLRANRLDDAATIFGPVVRADPGEASALLGLASVRRRQGLLEQALPLYLAAQRLRPKDTALARRTGEVKLDVAEAAIARAGALSAEGRKSEAIAMLQKALEVAPELSPVRIELADLLIEAGRRTEALSMLSAAQDPDRNVTLRIAAIRYEDGDLDGAELALRRGFKDPAEDQDASSLLAKIREGRALLALPEQLRTIASAPRITRAELAALVIARVESLGQKKPVSPGGVASDLSRTWARTPILRAMELGLMDVYPNHTFQPAAAVRRGELAVVSARVLDLLGWGRSSGAAPRDMSPSHLQYASVIRVLGAGVMQNAASGAFEPWRIVSGVEAKTVVDSLARLSASR